MASIRSSRVVVYSGAGCHLCERALAVVREVCGERFREVEIDGDEALEAAYRELLPVVEVDGEPAFTFDAFSALITCSSAQGASTSHSRTSSSSFVIASAEG